MSKTVNKKQVQPKYAELSPSPAKKQLDDIESQVSTQIQQQDQGKNHIKLVRRAESAVRTVTY